MKKITVMDANTLKSGDREMKVFSPAQFSWTGEKFEDCTIFCNAAHLSNFEAGERINAIVILDPLAWLRDFNEAPTEYSGDEIKFAQIRK